MTKIGTLLFGGACVVLGAGSGALAQQAAEADLVWRWPAALDATTAAPKNHRILYEDDHVSLLEVTVQPGEKENLHGHQLPSVFATDAIQPSGTDTDEHGVTSPLHPRFMVDGPYPKGRRMGPQAPHAFHDLDTFPQHFYRIQFKRIDGSDPKALMRYVKKS